MTFYPISLDVRNRKCLVVGGGSVGSRKAGTLLDCGALVTVVEPAPSDSLQSLSDTKALTIVSRSYRSKDLDDMLLVIGATDDRKLNRRISQDAARRGILCNIADQPEDCSFILPAVIRRGDLVISVSTSGCSPAMAKKLRKELENQFGEEYAEFLKLMGAIRHQLLRDMQPSETHKAVFEDLIRSGLLDLIKENRRDDVDRLLRRVLGDSFRYADLMTGG